MCNIRHAVARFQHREHAAVGQINTSLAFQKTLDEILQGVKVREEAGWHEGGWHEGGWHEGMREDGMREDGMRA
jgi:hypothetical protein